MKNVCKQWGAVLLAVTPLATLAAFAPEYAAPLAMANIVVGFVAMAWALQRWPN